MARIQSGSEQTLTPAGEGYPVIISATAPTKARFPDLIVGQLWLDTTVPQLKRCTNADTPTYTSTEGSTGANTALSNLASVAINTALLDDAAAADDFGSATLPWKDIFLAGSSLTPGTNNFRITGASTSGTRVITLPDAAATLLYSGGALGTPASGVLTNATGLPTAGMLDDAVTLAKMAAGTDGNLITYDVNGDPAAVATGTAGQVLTSNGAGAAPTFQAAGSGAVTRAGGNTTEATTTSTTGVTLLSATVSIGASVPFEAIAQLRRTTGAAASVSAGVEFNNTKVFTEVAWTNTGNAARQGIWHIVGITAQTDYTGAIIYTYSSNFGLNPTHNVDLTSDLPIATITTVEVTALVANNLITMAADDLHVYSYAVS